MCIYVGICIGIRASSYLADSLGAAWVLCGAVYQPKRPENSCRHAGPDCHSVDETYRRWMFSQGGAIAHTIKNQTIEKHAEHISHKTRRTHQEKPPLPWNPPCCGLCTQGGNAAQFLFDLFFVTLQNFAFYFIQCLPGFQRNEEFGPAGPAPLPAGPAPLPAGPAPLPAMSFQ